jgi:hypothetical protein
MHFFVSLIFPTQQHTIYDPELRRPNALAWTFAFMLQQFLIRRSKCRQYHEMFIKSLDNK